MKYKIDIEGLKVFLSSLNYEKIQKGALVKAHTRNDIDFFCHTDEEKSKIKLNQVIEYNEPFLVDAIGNDLSVCILTRKKYKLPTGRVVNMKFHATIINNCREVFGSCVNGYFVIPDRFIVRK